MKYWKEFLLVYGGCVLIGLTSGSALMFGVLMGLAAIIHGLISIVIKATEPKRS